MKRKVKLLTAIFVAFACGMLTHSKLYAKPHNEFYKPRKRVRPAWVKTGQASWYSRRSPGIRKRTANNEIFNDAAMTAAMWGVPFNQRVRVTNLDNGKSIVVRINDRGPHRRFVRRGRIIDLSRKAFSEIGGLRKGLIRVQVELL